MAQSRKKGGEEIPQKDGTDSGGFARQPLEALLAPEDLERMSALQILDVISARFPGAEPAGADLRYLRGRVESIEEMNDQARQALVKYEEAVEKLRSPALRVGTFLGKVEPDLAQVCVGGTDYVCRLDPAIPLEGLEIGQRVLCNEAFAVVRSLGFDRSGPVVRVEEALADGRIRIGGETGQGGVVVIRSSLLSKEKLKPGMELRLDPAQRVALEVLGVGRRIERALETVTETPWSSIGGQDAAVEAIRDAIELPFLHRDLFQRFDHTVPKGFLLHGPPGCGKTLLGKATAWNLRARIREQTGEDHPEFFLHVKGPEILNMWVGESERQVRDLFAQCRERAREGQLAFLFIDEAESILGTRRGSRSYNLASTLVPMFCTEMDGLEPLSNVVVILASNRPDLIDPAILRPGRIDRKIRVRRPDAAGARRIYEIYLREGLPLAGAREELAQAVAEAHFARIPANEFLEVLFRSGRREVLYRGDLASGAVIAAVVERAKSLALRRAIAGDREARITREDLLTALEREHAENDLFPSGDLTEDWMKLTDFDPENVARLGPIRPVKREASRVV
ncbi:MAG: AAA family ATPase [Verrucomicrobiales bacterium]|nr:AAA family ATPase [Verrucomicrobiales bacterium]